MILELKGLTAKLYEMRPSATLSQQLRKRVPFCHSSVFDEWMPEKFSELGIGFSKREMNTEPWSGFSFSFGNKRVAT